MKTERLPTILLLGFVFALLIYILAFSFIQHARTNKGPWNVMFSTSATGQPQLLVLQAQSGISRKILFPNETITETNLSRSITFSDPNQTNVPFGEIIFQDLTFLPGTVTFNFFGHEIELLPRTLIVDKKEIPWKQEEPVSVIGTGKFIPKKRK